MTRQAFLASLREGLRGLPPQTVNDVIAETRGRLASRDIASVRQVREAGEALAGFSKGVAAAERRLKAFMYDNLYDHPAQARTARAASDMLARLYAAYAEDPSRMGEEWARSLPDTQPDRARHIADFIAGMTDTFAMRRYAELFGPPPAG